MYYFRVNYSICHGSRGDQIALNICRYLRQQKKISCGTKSNRNKNERKISAMINSSIKCWHQFYGDSTNFKLTNIKPTTIRTGKPKTGQSRQKLNQKK